MTDQSKQTLTETPQSELFGFSSKPFFKVSDVITGGLLAVNWIYPLCHLKNLSANIPMQYSLTGAINWSGSKYLMFVLPISATISYFCYLYKKMTPEQQLFPLKVPQNKPEKVSMLAKALTKALGIFTQATILAGSALLVKGPLASQVTRGKWIKAGFVSSGLAILFLYSGINFLLNKNWLVWKNE